MQNDSSESEWKSSIQLFKLEMVNMLIEGKEGTYSKSNNSR